MESFGVNSGCIMRSGSAYSTDASRAFNSGASLAASASDTLRSSLKMPAPVAIEAAASEAEAKPKRTRRRKADVALETPAEQPAVEAEAEAKPKRTRRKKAEPAAQVAPEAPAEPVALEKAPEPQAEPADAVPAAANDQPARKGWWQRTITDRF